MGKKNKRLDELFNLSPAAMQRELNAMTLGELLALAGLQIEVECEGATPEFNAEVTRLANAEVTRLAESFVADEHKQ